MPVLCDRMLTSGIERKQCNKCRLTEGSTWVCAEPLLTTSDVAEYCRVTRMGVSRWIRDGKLRAYRTPGGHFRILKSDFRDFLEHCGLPVDPDLFGGEKGKRVLLVSDDPDVARLIKQSLETSDECQLTWSTDAYDAGLKVATLHPDLIVLDMSMPGQDGFDLCRRIVRDPLTAHTKVLGLVDPLSPGIEERVQRCGATQLLVKPLEGQDLQRLVRSLLAG